MPVLLCVLQNSKEPTRAKINGVKKAMHTEIRKYSLADIGLIPEEVGLKGSPTYVSKAFRPIVEHKCEKIIFNNETVGEICEKILEFKAGADE